MVDALICQTLCIYCGHVGGKPTGCDSFGIGQCNHTIHGDLGPDRGPVKCLEQRFGQRKARGFDQNVIGPHGHRHQRFDCGDEIVGHGAANAAVGKFYDVLGGTVIVGAGFEDITINANGAKFIDQHRKATPL